MLIRHQLATLMAHLNLRLLLRGLINSLWPLLCFGRHVKPLGPRVSSREDLNIPNFASTVMLLFTLLLLNN